MAKPGRPKNSIRPVCPDCNQSHLAGVECPWPKTDMRYEPRRDSDRANVLDHRIHGLDEVLKDLHYNNDFRMAFRNATPVLTNLRAYYQGQLDEVNKRIEAEREARKKVHNVAILTADYVEGEPATYKGIIVSFSDDSAGARFVKTTGNFENDLAEASEAARAAGATTVMVSSSVDHYNMDRSHQAVS